MRKICSKHRHERYQGRNSYAILDLVSYGARVLVLIVVYLHTLSVSYYVHMGDCGTQS